MFVDTHIHLHFPEYEADRAEVIRRSQEAGVGLFINVGTDAASSQASLSLANQYDFVYAAAGLHPHDANRATAEELDAIEKLLQEKRMVAIGEVGLDFFRDHSTREEQEEVFRRFLSLHQKIKKPLIIHCRDAYDRMLEVLEEEIPAPVRGVMHCFSSDRATMERFVEYGFYISFAGPLTYKKNDVLREACKACPKDRLLFETDAPFLPPQTARGKRNEPAYLLETARTGAELHGVTLEELGKMTTANAKRLFGIC